MIGSLRGILLSRVPGQVLIDVQGVGYEVSVTPGSHDAMPAEGQELQLFVSESMAMYGGGTTLYGFLTLEDKAIYTLLREIPGTGAKKALDYLDKISKSTADFRRAIIESDSRTLISLFGFTKKTAEKMILALKEPIAGLRVSGKEKWTPSLESNHFREALSALVTLGYRENEARTALDRLSPGVRTSAATAELVKEALKNLSSAN